MRLRISSVLLSVLEAKRSQSEQIMTVHGPTRASSSTARRHFSNKIDFNSCWALEKIFFSSTTDNNRRRASHADEASTRDVQIKPSQAL
jgi:hypothetical protein